MSYYVDREKIKNLDDDLEGLFAIGSVFGLAKKLIPKHTIVGKLIGSSGGHTGIDLLKNKPKTQEIVREIEQQLPQISQPPTLPSTLPVNQPQPQKRSKTGLYVAGGIAGTVLIGSLFFAKNQ